MYFSFLPEDMSSLVWLKEADEKFAAPTRTFHAGNTWAKTKAQALTRASTCTHWEVLRNLGPLTTPVLPVPGSTYKLIDFTVHTVFKSN